MEGLAFERRALDTIPFTLVDITMEKKREKRLFYLATTDKLTKLLNRHAGIKIFENLLYQAQRYGVPFSLLIIDIDNFKKINDELGHLAGDLALRKVAKAIKRGIRKSESRFQEARRSHFEAYNKNRKS